MEYKSLEFKESAVDMSARTIEGYVSTWDLDQTNDIINEGAFKKTIAEGMPSKRIKMLWQHDAMQPLGMPTEMYEDSKGLYAKGKISRTQLGDDALELMRDGVVDRFSIGFSIPQNKSGYTDEGVRVITEVKLFEFSPVTFPANEAATIDLVKSLHEQLHIAKSKGLQITDSVQLSKMIDELKALLPTKEPSIDTLNEAQPLVLEALDELKSLGDFARSLNK